MLEKLISALPAFIHYSVVKKPKSRTYKNNSNWFNVYYFLFILRNFLFPTCNTLLIKISEFTSIESIFLSQLAMTALQRQAPPNKTAVLFVITSK